MRAREAPRQQGQRNAASSVAEEGDSSEGSRPTRPQPTQQQSQPPQPPPGPLQQQATNQQEPQQQLVATKLVTHNRTAAEENAKQLAQLAGAEQVYRARDWGTRSAVAQLEAGCVCVVG